MGDREIHSARAAILVAAAEIIRDEPDRIIVRSRSGRVDFWRPVDGELWRLAETTGVGEPQARPWLALA